MSKRYPGGIIRKTPPTPSQTSAQGIWDMASVTQSVKENTWPIAGVPDPISKSLRFRSSASAYLNRTPASAGNQKTWTWSAWVKRSNIGTNGVMLGTETVNSQTYCSVYFVSDKIYLDAAASNVETMRVYTNAVFRDPSAWYHVVVYLDTTQATAANRTAIYVNGVLQTLTVSTNPAQNLEPLVNSTVAHNIGRNPLNLQYFDGYMTEINFIDGQALTPSSFGNTNDQTGVWQPIAYTGTYGTNGFYLPFSNTASTTTLGYDFSGNSNNWTPNNISLTSGSTYDSMVDVPTQWIPYNTAGDTGALFRGNYCTLNPVKKGTTNNPALSNGNLTYTAESVAAQNPASSTMGVSTGSWYYEATITNSGYNPGVGVADPSDNFGTGDNWRSFMKGVVLYGSFGGEQYVNGSYTGSTGYSFTTGDIMGIAFDASSGKVWVAKNNTWFNSGNPSAGTGQVATASSYSSLAPIIDGTNNSGNKDTINVNFGQRPFSYTPPAGFKTLCTTNLSTPTIGATASTVANKYFDISLYTGNGSTQSITNSGSMQPDFVWLKMRSGAVSHGLFDSIRGVNKLLYSDLTNAESPFGSLSAFNSNGFSLTTGSEGNTNGSTYVGWQWRASNAAGVTNTAGSITSTVSANTTAGFSIVTYTGSGAAGTVGHGLGVAPSMIIIKDRDNGTYDWNVYHASLSSPTTLKLYLNTTDAETNGGTNSGTWNSTAPTSTVFSLGTFLNVNKSGDNFVAYCFAAVAGYSAFGKYTGNGSTDGPFVFTGFRPKYVLIKASSTTGDWWLEDTTRNPYNAADLVLFPNTSGAESGSGVYYWDFLSNGFKLRSTSTGYNGSGTTYIYAAFAESPFKFSLAR